MMSREYAACRDGRFASQKKKNGFIQKRFLAIVAILVFSAGNYLFSINQNAVHGYRIRSLEKEIAVLDQENSKLRISEAETRSLEKTKEAGDRMGMGRATEVISVERLGVVAMK
jgi:hypothetical protein